MEGMNQQIDQKMRVLVAEDDPVSRRLLQAALTEWGFAVTATSDGASARDQFLAADGPKLGILDWVMPGLSGPEVCEAVRREPVGRNRYLVLLTSRDGSNDAVCGLESGANDYITKPFDYGELRARVKVGERMIRLQDELAARVAELEAALDRERQLQGLLPICAYCKKIRDDQNYWHQVEVYVSRHSNAQFSHGMCPDCFDRVMKTEVELIGTTGATA
jgi:phosphoserine phosphatase RsbU/P